MKYKFLYFLLLALSLTACAPPVYFASGFQGQIVDAQTGQPLEKVIVVGLWIAGGVGFGDTGLDQRLHVYETVTDSQGYFSIPAAVVPRNPFSRSPGGPSLRSFKQGYLAKTFFINDDLPFRLPPLSEDMSVEEQAIELSALFQLITDDYNPQDWKHYPRMLLAVSAETQRLYSIGASLWILPSIPDINNFSKEDKQFLEGFKDEI